jgi:hypothetical protein
MEFNSNETNRTLVKKKVSCAPVDVKKRAS